MRQFTPRDYQRAAIAHMIETPRCALHAGTGTGKTVSTLTALDALILAGECNKALVLGPLRVARETWTDEAAKWAHLRHLRISRIIGTPAQRRAALRADADIYVTNYEQLPWLAEQLDGEWPFDVVVADESTKLKGFRLRQGTQRAKALAQHAHTSIKRFIELTGTPASNGLVDLWGQGWFIDAGTRLGRSFSAFESRWFTKGYDGFSIKPTPNAFDEITERLDDVCLSIEAKDFMDLSEQIENNVVVTLPDKAMQQYREMEREMFVELENTGVEAFNAASKTIKCLQLASGTLKLDDTGRWAEVHEAKLEALDSIIEEAAGMPVLVAYNFVADRERLLERYGKNAVDLATESGLRRFKAGEIRVGIGHPASIGHGIDGLQYATNIIAFFGVDWNLENRLQIIERIGPTRQFQAGFKRPVYVHNIVAKGTLDELVLQRVATKADVQQLLIERMKGGTP